MYCKIFALLLSLTLVVACSEDPGELKSTFNIGGSSKATGSGDVRPETVQADNGKASDDDEGIPGYMSNIEVVETNITEDSQYIISAEGTVSIMPNRDIFATAWIIPRDSMTRIM